MSLVSKMFWGVALLGVIAVAAAAVDFGLDEGRFVYALMGRDHLVSACLPELVRGLSREGYAPTDIEMEARPALGLGRRRSLAGRFTFADGPGETRIDGIMACLVEGQAVHVDFRATALPRRAA